MKRPNFFIAGAPKCGTTALSEYLKTHPNVFMCTPKEPHYFAYDFPHFRKEFPNLESYLKLFSEASSKHLALGEASVWYLYSQVALREIQEFAPHSKIIVMLRNPIYMAQSLHTQLLWTLDEDVKDFSVAWGLQEDRRRGRAIPTKCREPAFLQYGEVCKLGVQVENLINIFSRKQIKIIFLEDLQENPRHVYLDILNFLGLTDDGRAEFPKINVNKYNKSSLLARFTQRMPGGMVRILKVYKRIFGIKRLGWRRRLQSFNAVIKERPRISLELQQEMVRYFEDDIKLLEKLTDKDLSHWLVSV